VLSHQLRLHRTAVGVIVGAEVDHCAFVEGDTRYKQWRVAKHTGGPARHAASHERWRNVMRVAVLLSSFFLICGIAAFFGVPAVGFSGQPIVGVRGFVAGLVAAAVPLLVVSGWRKVSGTGLTSRSFWAASIVFYAVVASLPVVQVAVSKRLLFFAVYAIGVHWFNAYLQGTPMHLADATLESGRGPLRKFVAGLGVAVALGTLQFLLGWGSILPG